MWKIISCQKKFDKTPENSPEQDITKCSKTGRENEIKVWIHNVSQRRNVHEERKKEGVNETIMVQIPQMSNRNILRTLSILRKN